MYPNLTQLQRRCLPIECRPMISSDIDTLCRMQLDDDAESMDRIHFVKRMSCSHWKVYVAIPTRMDHRFPTPGDPVGFIACGFFAGVTRIERIAVHPWARRERIATRLWSHMLVKIPRGYETVHATVRERNIAAQPWLRFVGMTLVSVKQNAYADPDRQWEREDGYVFEGRVVTI